MSPYWSDENCGTFFYVSWVFYFYVSCHSLTSYFDSFLFKIIESIPFAIEKNVRDANVSHELT
jgi:hypothetical protein